MDLEFTISAREAGSSLQVEIADNRASVTGLASGRKIVFEGVFGDICVKLLPVEAQAVAGSPVTATPAALPEAAPEVTVAPPVTGAATVPGPSITDVAAAPGEADLFRRLVALRKQISSEVKLPPFVIFHDSTLREMCRRLPADLEALRTVSGVGEAKLAKYGARFLEVIAGHLKGKEV